MGRDESDQIAHEGIIEFHLPGPGIYCGCLEHIPVMYQLHHVVIPADMTLQVLSATRVCNIRTIGIFDILGEIADYVEPFMFQTHSMVILRPFFGDYVMPEPYFFKSVLTFLDFCY